MLSSDTPRTYRAPLSTPRFWVTIAICAVLYVPTLFWSLGLDQNIFAEIGALILHGSKPYVNAWDVKPPNVFYTYALFEWILGQNEFAVRISDYVFAILSCGAIYVGIDRRLRVRAVSDWLAKWAPVVSAILLSLTLLSLGLSDTAQTESYALFFILIAAYLAIGTSRTRVLAAGVMIAIATFYKTTNVVFLLPLVIELSVARITVHHRLRALSFLLIGFVAASSLELAALAFNGSLAAYLRITLQVAQHHSSEPGDISFAALLRALWVTVDIWTVLAAAAIAVAVVREDRTVLKVLRLPLLYLAVGLFAVYVQRKGWGYHYVITHPGLISTAGIAATYLVEQLRYRSKWLACAVIALIVAATIGFTPSARRRIHYTRSALTNRSDYIASLGSKQSLYYPECTDSLAEYLRRTTASSDSVFILGEEPGAYWKSQRPPATRYIYALLFTSGVMDSREIKSIGYDLALKKPRTIVVERFDTTAFRGRPETSESLLGSDSNFVYLRYLLSTEYDLRDTVCDKFLIYRRR